MPRRKYAQALNLLLRAHSDSENYVRMAAIAPHIEAYLTDESVLLTARAFYNLERYTESIKYFEKLRLTSDLDLILLCSAYVQSGNRARAVSILSNAPANSSFINTAKENEILKPIIDEIQARRSLVQ